ncbi:MAG: DNA-directed RNA polymerase subunit RpoH/Rpb5 C-terminal domain-containing protein [archaeon]
MHVLQPKHEKLTEKEVEKLLERLNIALAQLPKISKKDPALPEGCKTGDAVKITRADEEYFRVVI